MMISAVIAGAKNRLVVSALHTRVACSFFSTLSSDKVSTAKPGEPPMPKANGVASSKLTGETISPHVMKAEYAVRGDIVVRAGEIGKELKKGKKFPFTDLVMCNIGNPQALGQKPITFYRQVLAICDYPQLLDAPESQKLFPPDVLKRAKEYLDATGSGGTGAYTHSQGVELCRQHVAQGIKERDGYDCNVEDLYLTEGASGAVKNILQILIRNEKDAILIPYPQYPLYSAAIALLGGTVVPYYPDEKKGWQIDPAHLEDVITQAGKDGLCIRALAVITPGNPTGQVIPRSNIEDLIKVSKKHELAVIADEVYQVNVYNSNMKFDSFKKTIKDMGSEYDDVPLFSLQSISKGYYGECGRRGGYMEIINIPEDVRAAMYKVASINLCSNVNGQICTAMVMNPPKDGEESYPLYKKEKDGLIDSLKRRAEMIEGVLNELEGVSCTSIDGALYAFPTITLPEGAFKKAKEIGKTGEWLYCKEMLENTGIVIVPGNGFGQKDGTHHFRTTILPGEDQIESVCDRMRNYHKEFLSKYKN